MEKKYIILKEEFPITEQKIKKFEEEKNIELPDDYREFILTYNGGVIIPDYPRSEKLEIEIDPIDRFYSLQDMELGVQDDKRERMEAIKEQIEEHELDIELNKLLFIGITERGHIHLYCGEDEYGEIFYSNFAGGFGLEKTGLKSFSELLESMTPLNEDWEILNDSAYKNGKLDKIFTFWDPIYWEEEIKEKSLERFKEVLSFYGDPNKIHPWKEKDVVEYYTDYPLILKYLADLGAEFPKEVGWISNLEAFQFLISKGLSIEGMLNKTNNLEIIQYLIEEHKQDLNQPVDGKYPLITYTRLPSIGPASYQYEFIKKVLELGYTLNLDIKDEKGQSVRDRIKILEDHL